MSKEIHVITNFPEFAKQLQRRQVQEMDTNTRRAGRLVILVAVLAATLHAATDRPQKHYEPVNNASIPATRTIDSSVEAKDAIPEKQLPLEPLNYGRAFQNYSDTLDWMKNSNDQYLIGAANSISGHVWSSDASEPGHYAKVDYIQVEEGGRKELKIILLMGSFDKEMKGQAITEAAIELYQAKLLHWYAQNDLQRFLADKSYRRQLENRVRLIIPPSLTNRF